MQAVWFSRGGVLLLGAVVGGNWADAIRPYDNDGIFVGAHRMRPDGNLLE